MQQYEKAYLDAREVLYFRGKKVAKPTFGEDGFRYCPVDGFLLTDRGVFKEAWGDQLADEILRELTESDSFHKCCSECGRLWLRFADATHQYVDAFTRLQTAANPKAFSNLADLDLSLKDAAERRQSARQNVRHHAAMHEAKGRSVVHSSLTTHCRS